MNNKYYEIVQFFRDSDKQAHLQKAVNEYQYFAKVYNEIEYVLNLDISKLNDKITERLDSADSVLIKDPKLEQVIDEVKLEIADSIYFHSDDLN